MTRLFESDFNRLISSVQKPARYTGGELNAIDKELADVRLAISYPDLYEIGMSNNGIQILYHAANRVDGVACERVFAVDTDMEARLRSLSVRLFTLETRTPLSELDMIGFSVAHELLATNILQVLDLGGIPLQREERGGSDPIVIAGGAACSNPLPLSGFIDAFFIGDGEEGIVDIILYMKRSKADGATRAEMIEGLSAIESMYVPAVHGHGPSPIRKRTYRSIKPLVPNRPVIPSIRITQERVSFEVTRGCGNLCKYCHAGYYELPYRTYHPSGLREIVEQQLDATGYEEISLSSLSLGDYANLTDVLNDIMPVLVERGVSLSLPSLRVDRDTLGIVEHLGDIRRSTLTFAVEAAAGDMRRRAHKNISTDDLIEIIDHVFSRGWRAVKLYFMLGMPGCDEHDEASEIAALLKRLLPPGGKRREINVTLSPFIPKPHTPFQRERQREAAYFEQAVRRIKQSVPRKVSIKNHDVLASTLEGVLSRGDDRLGPAIRAAYESGCRLDSWKEHFRFDRWTTALDAHAPGWRSFLEERVDEAPLPWGFIVTGHEKLTDYMARKTTVSERRNVRESPTRLDTEAIASAFERFKRRYAVTGHARLRIGKTGDARFIPHIDFMEIVKRALRIARAPVAFSQGFNKRERLSTGFPVPVGIESAAELIDIELHDAIDPGRLMHAMNRALPRGIIVSSIRLIPASESIMAATIAARYHVGISDMSLFSALQNALATGGSVRKRGKSGIREVPFESVVLAWQVVDADDPGDSASINALATGTARVIALTLTMGTENSVRIDETLRSLTACADDDLHRFSIVKVAQYRSHNGAPVEIV